MKIKKAVFLVTMEWIEDNKKVMTAQIGRDKLFTALQELWVMHILSEVSIKEVHKPGLISRLMRVNEPGPRSSLYDSKKKEKA